MIDFATAATIATLVGEAVGAIDVIFRGYVDFIKGKDDPQTRSTAPDLEYTDSPDQDAFVAQSRQTGRVLQKVSYAELCQRLAEQDRAYIETLSRSMENYQKQWNAAWLERSNADEQDRVRLDAKLDDLLKQMADPLTKVLDFVERMGLWLDDHYLMARQLAAPYLAEGTGSRG